MYGGVVTRDKIKRDKTNKKQERQDSRDRDKTKKETKSLGGGRRVLGTQSREKGLYLQMEHPVLGPLLRLPWGQTPKGIRISRRKDQSASFLAQDVAASISLRTVHNGRVCRPCLQRKRSRETKRLVLIAHTVW